MRGRIELALYENAHTLYRTLTPMTKRGDGVFFVRIPRDLRGYYYTYLVDGNTEVTDPYSIASAPNSRRSAIVALAETDPEGWDAPGVHDLPPVAPTDALIYESHLRDLTAHPSAGSAHPGKYLGLVTTARGEMAEGTIPIRHLRSLGVTHLHLLPLADFFTLDETVSDPERYNWGYDPELFHVPEGSYAVDLVDPTSRIRELKTMILALHRHGIRVVLDVVYNHSYKSYDSNLHVLAPHHYHRMNHDGSFSNGSGVGNEIATETPEGRRFVLESLLYWVREYRVDGFRFDLMALMDRDTVDEAVRLLRSEKPDLLLYGEPWLGGPSVLPDSLRTLRSTQRAGGFALFNDRFRDAIRGDNDGDGLGYVQGNVACKAAVMDGICGSPDFTDAPSETINYFSAHDNLILQDKLARTAAPELVEPLTKLAFGILLTAQGIPFVAAGTEFGRSKQGNANSYNAPLSVNAIDWGLRARHAGVLRYVQDLVSLRATYPQLRLRSGEAIRERLRFADSPPSVIDFSVQGDSSCDSPSGLSGDSRENSWISSGCSVSDTSRESGSESEVRENAVHTDRSARSEQREKILRVIINVGKEFYHPRLEYLRLERTSGKTDSNSSRRERLYLCFDENGIVEPPVPIAEEDLGVPPASMRIYEQI